MNSLIVSSKVRLTLVPRFGSRHAPQPACTAEGCSHGPWRYQLSSPPQQRATALQILDGECLHNHCSFVSVLFSSDTFSFFSSFQWKCRVPDNSGHLKGKLWELGEQGPTSQRTHAWYFRKAQEPGTVTLHTLFCRTLY